MLKGGLVKAAVAVVVIGTAGGYLVFQTARSSYAYYYSVDEFVENGLQQKLQNSGADGAADNGPMVRLVGRVKKGSLVKTLDGRLDFELVGQVHSIAVGYQGIVPPNFTEDREVVVQGTILDSGAFQADKILTRCESKYQVKLDTQAGVKN